MRITLKLPANGKRLIHDLTKFNLPEFPYLAAQNLPFTTMSLPTHLHRNRMEINHIIKGERVYRVANRDYHLKGNQVFITWPDEVHGSGSYLHGRGLHFWAQIELPHPGAAFLGLNPVSAGPLLEALWTLPRRHFRAGSEMRSLYARVLDLCRAGPSPLTRVRIAALLTEWLLEVIVSTGNAPEDEVTPDIAKTLRFMDDNAMEHFTVPTLAEVACLSESRFKIKFRDQMGTPPGDYLQRRRLEVAVRLLKERHGIAEVADKLGFSSSQHFSTTFKKFFGKSPLVWLRENDNGMAELDREHGIELPVTANGLRPWVDAEGRLHGYICNEE